MTRQEFIEKWNFYNNGFTPDVHNEFLADLNLLIQSKSEQFAEWAGKQGYYYDDTIKSWVCFINKPKKTTEQLYDLYLEHLKEKK